MSSFNKDILYHPEFYIVKFTKNKKSPYILFIHGGPGFNCGVNEYLIEKNELFTSLEYNIILYDQRNCGKSKRLAGVVSHQDNIDDLQKVISYLTAFHDLNINALVGHSYGAKLLFDFYKSYLSLIPGVFVSTASSILIPRLNNLMLDLSYLKQNNPHQYNKIFNINSFDLNKLWEISEQLTPLFQENKNRPYLYWANLEKFKMVQEVQQIINLPINMETFLTVRKDLYSSEANFSVDINQLDIPKLWINGFHDFIMNGQETALAPDVKISTFYKSAHYPHIEENEYFSEILNEFVQSF
ncbi:alpha/beta fold hydrolase [Legionella sp. CNM-1927-20]|uniref:alpha/beta fold hydrolase n=1 Tax=Legionella sp. CNM-1927-20 TaxID=3422221 RepID=UPI00403B2751